jgi:RimJ/RimL family protein N-acetyltransferase
MHVCHHNVIQMLNGKNILLKPLEEKHLEDLRRLRNSALTHTYLTSALPVNDINQKVWFETVSRDNTKMYFAIEDYAGLFVGFARCDEWDRVNGSIRVGVDIIPDKRRQGYALDAYHVLLRYLFGDLRTHRVWLLVIRTNSAAMSLYKKIGFKEEGVQREAIFRNNGYKDYISMSMLSTEYEGF